MKTEREIFADNLSRLIEESKTLNKAKIAAELGVSRATLSDYTIGKAYPRPSNMAKLCEILGVSQYDLTTNHYQEQENFIPNRELWDIAKEIYEDPEARRIYTAMRSLSLNEKRMVKAFITALEQEKRGCE